jgi:alpha,alpha-trehalose-phosphate synthase [UDP-forming]
MSSNTNPAAPDPKRTKSLLLDERFMPKRFLVVSNRLPYRLAMENGTVQCTPGVGGLVTALDPVLRVTGGTWMGWSGTQEQLPEKIAVEGTSNDYSLRLLSLSPEEVDDFYLGYSNQAIWPLFHYYQEHSHFNSERWAAYERVNRKFADAIIDEHREGDLIWIHDYHLMLVPAMVRRALPEAQIGFFLHIPFPSAELFLVDPHAERFLEGIIGADLVGFHIKTYARNFINAVETITRHSCKMSQRRIAAGDRFVQVGVFPISIPFEDFEGRARAASHAGRDIEIRDYYHADILALGVDRLDYTKGILERLQAIEIMLDRHPELQGKFTFLQISAPSRAKVQAYEEMREKVEQMVGRINGRFAAKGCVPVDYRYQSYSQEELAAFYRAADAVLVTPVRDGMNLVAKEYVASQYDGRGALVLSRFTGAYEELKDAFIVNPYQLDSMAEAIYQSLMAAEQEKRERMSRMRAVVRRNDIYWWLEQFLRALP